MKIKRLELVGFKSFVDPTVVNFDAAIVGVVGPNGCGKSNIVDAIRWVMGEMSAKSLRGHAMEDVIFNGSDARTPINMAEVSLTFSTEDGIIPPEYVGYTEVTITRRLYRSGESEYLINKTACRLRDIVELFLGTGVGHKAYSVIEQGKIDFAINAKPEDRRLLIEEAAGISKFKSRKEAALRKMEGTKNNLARLKDILAEVTRQCNSLDRQVKKAERYKMIKNELREKELRLYSVRHLERAREIAEIGVLLEDWLQRDNKASASLGLLETQLEEQRLVLVEKERDLNALQEKFYESSSRQKLLETQQQFQSKEKQSLEEQRERSVMAVEQLKEQQNSLRQEIAEQLRRHEEIRDESGLLTNELQQMEADWKSSEARRVELTNTVATLRTGIHRAESEAGRIEGEKRLQEEQCISLHGRMAKISVELEEMAQLKQGQVARLEGFRQDQQKLLENRTALLTQAEELQAEMTQLKEHKDLMEEEFSFRQEELMQKRSRLKSLLDLERNFEGYDEGVRSILKAKKERAAGEKDDGIFGIVADFVDAPPEYETAVSAALGEKLQHVIVKSHEEGVEAISYLKTQSSGRSTFIPLQPREVQSTPFPYEGSGIIGPLLSKISLKQEFQQIGQYLLGDIILVETLSRALSIWQTNGYSKTLVTLDGEVVDPYGVVSGGTTGIRGKILLEKKREIKELRGVTAELDQELSLKEDTISQSEGTLSELGFTLEGLEKKQHETELRLAALERDLALLTEDLQHFDQEKMRLHQEREQLQAEEKRVQEAIGRGEERRLELLAGRQDHEQQLTRVEEEARQIEGETRSAAEELTRAKVQSAAALERQASFEQEREKLQKQADGLQQRIDEERGLISELQQKLIQLESSLKTNETENQALKAVVEELASGQEEVRKAYDFLNSEVRNLEESIRQTRKEVELARSHTGDLRLTLSQLESDQQYQEAQIFERYSVSLKETAGQYQGVEVNAELEEQEVAELKTRLDKLGDVNLGAIPEFEELRTRQNFLEKQITDLENSLDALQKAIQRINQTTRQRFEETFALVSERFEALLPRLFRGGRAELRLTETDDPTKQGVELLVQPPGKKLSHISLLSGGEKALSAVGFIFSIFLVKPSPFCILDEVDAPLDDTNVDRFLQLLSDTVSRSQFILITHNRRTMEKCELLYGVTMEEPGISKTVSVRLSNQEQVPLAS